MANKLKNMLLKSVDLVKRGANPDADIKLYKSIDGGPEDNIQVIMKSDEEIEDMIEKSDDLMGEYTKILKDSFTSILNDETLGADEAREMMAKSMMEFNETVVDEIIKTFSYTHGNESEGEEMNYKDILKSENLTEDERKQLSSLVGKACGKKVDKACGKKVDKAEDDPDYEIEDDDPEEPEMMETKGRDNNMKKSYEEIIKKQYEQLEALQKRFDMQDLVTVAKKYEAIGENAEDLAKTLYDMKAAGEEVYKSYIGTLDKTLELYQKSGLFTEVGKSYGAPVVGNIAKSDAEAKIDAFADGIQKADPNMNRVQAIAKAWEDHPELAAEYEASRR